MNRRRFAWLIALWSLPAILTVLQMQTTALIDRRPLHSLPELVPTLCEWLMWVPLTPLILSVATRFPLTRRRLSIAVHAAGIASVSTVRGVVYSTAIFLVLGRGDRPPFPAYTVRIVLGWLPVAALVYGAVVAAAAAIASASAIREREIQASELRAELARAELQTLRAKIQPHFLFNALHSIAALARARDLDGVVESIAMLGDLLRDLAIRPRAEEVRLADEIELVQRYLAIEELRFRDRLRVSWHVDESAAEVLVPAFVLQSLVENALRHGISARIDSGQLRIAAIRRDSSLELSVTDDGAGPPERGDAANGIGLSSLRRRLALHHGAAASLTLQRGAHGGSVALVSMPARLPT